MTNNPFANARDQSEETTRTQQPLVLDKARVLRSDADGGVIVELLTDTDIPPIPVKVGFEMSGSAAQPSEGTEVLVTYSANGEAWIIDTYYTQSSAVPDYEVGERILGHESTDANIHFQNDGSIDINSDKNGNVFINGQPLSGFTDSRVNVSDSGVEVDTNVEDINFDTDLIVTDDGDNSVTVDANTFSGSHDDLTNVSSDDHHVRYTNEEAQDTVASMLSGGTNISLTYDDVNDILTIDSTASSYTDEDAQDAVGTILDTFFTYDDAGNSISLNESNISHDNIDQSTVSSDDHHTKTQPSDIDSTNWSDYEIQKNGTDGAGIINFKT